MADDHASSSTSRLARHRKSLFATAPAVRTFSIGNMRGLLSLMRREYLREMRWFGLAVIGPAIQSALFAAVFSLAAQDVGNVDGIDFLTFLTSGLVIAAVMQRGFETTGYSIMFDKLESDGLQDILGAPLNAWEILTAYIVNAVTVSVAIGLGIWLVLSLFGLGFPVNPLSALFYLSLAAALFAAIGLVAAIFSKKWDSLSGKETFLMLPTIFLSGTFFPITAVPEGIWRMIFQLNPIYYAVDGFRWAVTGRAETDLGIGLLIVGGTFAVFMTVAAALFMTGRNIKP